MKKAIIILAVLLFAVVLTSCATRHALSDFDTLRVGMTEAEVLSIYGKPDSRGFDGQYTTYVYNDVYASFWGDDYCTYTISFENGVVAKFGQSSYNKENSTYIYVNDK
ncbi:MAG: outer membrane protein assembly factor BamE [Spirochaetales bacterium]|nr:outer membrane protein assembly factor BamE [Spirochaetales bacterium]